MPRGDAGRHGPEEPGASADTDIAPGHNGRAGPSRPAGGPPGGRASQPGRPRAGQREILAQFEAAIAGMHTREIQIGLRQLLGAPDASPAAAQEAPRADRADGVRADRADAGEEPETEAGGEPGTERAAALTVVRRPWIDLDQVPRPVAELVLAVRTPSARRQLERLVSEAELARPIKIDPDTAARMVRPYTWLLGRIGLDGIRLTDAGRLPPGEVAAVVDALSLGAGRTVRAGSPIRRENQAPAVVQLRQSAQATGLVGKQRGRLMRTAAGEELHHDPAGLWWHLAARMPLRSAAVSEVQPGLVLLACVAARFTETLDLTIARMLTAIGWMNGNGGPVTGHEAAQATSGTHAVLRRLGVLPDDPRGRAPGPTPEAVAFARAALTSWPAAG